MKVSKAAEGFKFSRIADGFAETTVRSYLSSLLLLEGFLQDPDIENVTPLDLKKFFHYLRTDYTPRRRNNDPAPLTSAAIHGKWKAVRALFTWASEELGIPNVSSSITMPTFTNREIIPFTETELQSLLTACDYTAEAVTGNRQGYRMHRCTALRDRMIVMVMLDTGVRVGELSRINIGDIDLNNRRISIVPFGQGKKSKGRFVKFGKGTRSYIWRYLSTREETKPISPFLMDQYGEHRLNCDSIKNLIRRLGERAGLSSCHVHKFRHTFAIQFLRNGGDVYTLQELLGHSTLDMCKRYLNISQIDLDTTFPKASPADNWRLK